MCAYVCVFCTGVETSNKYGEWIIKNTDRKTPWSKKLTRVREREIIREQILLTYTHIFHEHIHIFVCVVLFSISGTTKGLISYKSKLQNPSSMRESQTSGSSKGFWSGPEPFKALTQLSRGGCRVGPTSKHPKDLALARFKHEPVKYRSFGEVGQIRSYAIFWRLHDKRNVIYFAAPKSSELPS